MKISSNVCLNFKIVVHISGRIAWGIGDRISDHIQHQIGFDNIIDIVSNTSVMSTQTSVLVLVIRCRKPYKNSALVYILHFWVISTPLLDFHSWSTLEVWQGELTRQGDDGCDLCNVPQNRSLGPGEPLDFQFLVLDIPLLFWAALLTASSLISSFFLGIW